MKLISKAANFIVPTTWLVVAISFIFLAVGIFAEDILRVAAIFISLSIFFYSSITNVRILKIQTKLNIYLGTIFEWIFFNPWKCGLITFFILFFSYGLKGFYITDAGYDTGFFLQALSNPYANGIFEYITVDGTSASFFLNHFQPYLLLLYPIKFLPFPSVFLYCIAYAFLSFTLVFGIKFIQSESNIPIIFKVSLLLTCLSFAFWHGIASYEFHELALIPLFYLFMFISWYQRSFLKFFIFSLLSLSVKETVSITFLWSGLFLLLFGKKFDKKVGLTLIIMGGLVYILYFKVILVNLRGQSQSSFIGYYSSLGNTMLEVILSPILKPLDWLKSIFQYKNFQYLFLLIFPIIFYLRGGWKALIFAFPTFYMLILPQYSGLTNYKNQYGGEILIPLCLCAFYGLKHLLSQGNFQNSAIFQRFVLSLSVISFCIFLYVNPIRHIKHFFKVTDNISFAYQLQSIPNDQFVMTNTDKIYPFIANRFGVYRLQNLTQYNEPEIKKINYFIYEIKNNETLYLPENTKLIDKYDHYYLYQKLPE